MSQQDREYLQQLKDILEDARIMVIDVGLNRNAASTVQLASGLENAASAIKRILKTARTPL